MIELKRILFGKWWISECVKFNSRINEWNERAEKRRKTIDFDDDCRCLWLIILFEIIIFFFAQWMHFNEHNTQTAIVNEWKKIRFTCCITKQQPTRKLNEHVRLFYDIISIFSASDFLAWLTFLFIYFYLFICFHSFASVSCRVQLKSRVSCRRIIYNFTSPFSPYIFSYTQFNLSEFIHFINNIDQAKETEIVSEN